MNLLSEQICRRSGFSTAKRIVYDGRPIFHPASIPALAGRTVTIGSVSKEYCMIGWRVGWVVAPPALTDRIALVQISDVVVPVGIAQSAAAVALEEGDDDVIRAVAEWQRRRDMVLKGPSRDRTGGWLVDAARYGRSRPWRRKGFCVVTRKGPHRGYAHGQLGRGQRAAIRAVRLQQRAGRALAWNWRQGAACAWLCLVGLTIMNEFIV